jgi:hypothetical protein
MPLHDWTRTEAGDWHHFHQSWTSEISRQLNQPGSLPKGYYAYIESKVAGFEPDVLAVQAGPRRKGPISGGVATLDPPRTQLVTRIENDRQSYARRANRISIRHAHGDIVGVIELVSPGNKDTRRSVKAFVDKAVEFLQRGVHFVLIDLFPPTVNDPHGIHTAIVTEIAEQPYDPPTGKDRVLVGYCAEQPIIAYIEPVGVGDTLPPVPLYLTSDFYVMLPLEATYAATWAMTPEPIRELLETAP